MPTGSKRILLGVSGGIAAYKAAELVRRLREQGQEVRCALTRAAGHFVSPLTLEVLTGAPVYQEEYLEANGSGEELHITAADWADVVCIAPATAHVIARMSLGLADDFLTTTLLAFPGPVVIAPAMHSRMWMKPTVQEHITRLGAAGVHIVGPEEGPLASGEIGIGRMADPMQIAAVLRDLALAGPLTGRKVVVTAGPTREPIDAVRFLSNRSSGKMGFAIAAEAARRGADTVLVSGPVALATPRGVRRLDVTTAREMQGVLSGEAGDADLIVMTAAVADFRAAQPAATKVKKEDQEPVLELEQNPDILAGLAKLGLDAVIAGFAAETHDVEAAALRKLEAKGADFLIANDVSDRSIGFDSEDNEVTVYRAGGDAIRIPRQAKSKVAARLVDLFTDELERRKSQAPVRS